jgi:SAM-dependent methyltransferase
MEQRFTFDQVASVYRTARPNYPEALVHHVVSYADLKPNDPVLEVGCGTGQATKSFAMRGLRIVAIDPGPEMVRAARETLANFDNVEVIETTFEAWPADKAPFRLIIAAQSWHWVSPELRFAKAAKVLSSNGSLAVFGQVPVGLPTSLLERFKEIFLRHSRWVAPKEAWYLPNGPLQGLFDKSGLFDPVEHQCYPWTWRHTRSSYMDFLRTWSDVRMLTPSKREELLGDISKAIDVHGEEFDVDYEAHLYIARRSSADK